MDYKNKYLKYKTKYLSLKGGGKYTGYILGIKKMIEKGEEIHQTAFVFSRDDFKLSEYKTILDQINKEQFKKGKILTKNFSTISINEFMQNNEFPEDILNYFEIVRLPNCSIDVLMTKPDIVESCKNLTNVTGSCGHPSFLETNSDINEEDKKKWLKLLNLIESKLIELKYIDLVIGATSWFNGNFKDKKNNLTLCITPISTFKKFDDIILDIESVDSLLNKNFQINFYFPLSHNFPNSKIVLDKILELNKKVPVRLTNRMCGSCFRSMYYLVNNGIEYSVDPEQGLNKIMDTDEIRKCFK